MIDKIKKKSKIMILGATGFIGKNIALYFSKNLKLKLHIIKKYPLKIIILNGLSVTLKVQNKLIIFLIILILSLMLQQ